MNRDERNAVMATIGLAIAALGASLPWARIGGRNRSGFNTADTFISLADGALPDQIAWVGRWWYLPAFLAVVSWATVFVSGRTVVRVGAIAFLLIGLAMWWLFYWAGAHYGLLNMHPVGPVVATIGLAIVTVAVAKPRGSILNP